jgi:thiamine biosynthesis lipoprotein ApbE
MSLLQHLEDEAQHVLDIIKKSIQHEIQSFGAAHPTSEALLKTLELHLDDTPAIPVVEQIKAPVEAVQVAASTPVSTEQNVA